MNAQNSYYYVKIGFWILTTNFTKTAFDEIVNKHKYKVNSIIKRMINEEIKHETLSNK